MPTEIWEKTIKQALQKLDNCTNKDKKYLMVAQCFQKSIQSGDIPINTALPAQRTLAKSLQLTLATINRIYQHLAFEQFIQSKPGKGSVTCFHKELNQADPIHLKQIDTRMMRSIELPSTSAQPLNAGLTADIEQILSTWMTCLHIPTHFRTTQLTHSIFEAINICFSGLLTTNDTVLCINLTQAGLSQLAIKHQINLKPLCLTEGVIDTKVLEQYCKIYQPKALFIHSHIHNPTGQKLTESQKKEIAQICAQYNVTIIEDISANWFDRPEVTFSGLCAEHTFTICSITALTNNATHYCAFQYPDQFEAEMNSVNQSTLNLDLYNATSVLNELFNYPQFFNQWHAKHEQLNQFINQSLLNCCENLLKLENRFTIYLGNMWIDCSDAEQSERLKMTLAKQGVTCLAQDVFQFDFQPQWLKPITDRSPSGVRICFAHLPFSVLEQLFLKIDESLLIMQAPFQTQNNKQYQPKPMNMT